MAAFLKLDSIPEMKAGDISQQKLVTFSAEP
jgi:hypothetical protein